MADNEELWEIGQVQDGLGGSWCISTVTLRGGMPPHQYDDEKIHYTVKEGLGAFLIKLQQGAWFVHPARPENIFTPSKCQAHFFISLGEEPLVLSVLSSPGVFAKRVAVDFPETVTIDATIAGLEGKAIIVSTPFGDFPATPAIGEVPKLGEQIRCCIKLPPVPSETEAPPDRDQSS